MAFKTYLTYAAAVAAAFNLGTAMADSAPEAMAPTPGDAPMFLDNDFIPEQEQRAQFSDADFTIPFAITVPGAGGIASPAILGSYPVLGTLTTGLSHVIFDLKPCGIVFPHIHPRGDESLFVISGTIDAGYVDEAGALVRNEELQPNQVFLIPQGYIHYVANPTCDPSKAVSAVPNPDGGFYGATNSLLAVPNNILQSLIPMADEDMVEDLRDAVAASGNIPIDPACAKRCNL